MLLAACIVRWACTAAATATNWPASPRTSATNQHPRSRTSHRTRRGPPTSLSRSAGHAEPERPPHHRPTGRSSVNHHPHRTRHPHRGRLRPRPATRDNLLAYAVGSHARPELITVIENLPDKAYTEIRDLWYDLPDVPVTA
ncbi:DUF2795 domain-containing protein [Phytohabitans rumicis]|uniref:DUF2795 domain-containing protein n=1 Tax=Phytohabitans rumicis TaxID=1076125 RepID=UPI001565F22A